MLGTKKTWPPYFACYSSAELTSWQNLLRKKRRPDGRLSIGTPSGARRRNPPLERKAQADADFPRATHDGEVVAPGVARIEPAVDVDLVEQVLAPDLHGVLAVRRLVHEARVQDRVGRLEDRLQRDRVDLRALIRG